MKSAPLPQPDFDDAEFILRSMDLKNTLMEGQHPCSLAEVTKVKNLPYREGIGPLMHVPMGINPKTPLTIAITAKIFTKILEDLGSMHSNVTRHIFQDLGGMRGINSVKGNVGDDLQHLLDPGGAPRIQRWGYMPNVDTRPVPGTPGRKEANVLSTTRKGERKEFSNSTSNPTVSRKNAMSAHETTDSDLPGNTTKTALILRMPHNHPIHPNHTENPPPNSQTTIWTTTNEES